MKKTPSKQKETQRLINMVVIAVIFLILAYIYYKYSASANVVWGD